MTIVAKAPNGMLVHEYGYPEYAGSVAWCDPDQKYWKTAPPIQWASRDAAMTDLRKNAPAVALWVEAGSMKLVEVGNHE